MIPMKTKYLTNTPTMKPPINYHIFDIDKIITKNTNIFTFPYENINFTVCLNFK